MSLQPWAFPCIAFEGMSIDLITDLVPDPDGNCFLLVIVCYFLKWVEIVPLRSKAACDIAITLYREVFAWYRCPKWITVDAGRDWEGDFKVLSELLGITIQSMSAGYPHTNGQSERIFCVIKVAFHRYMTSHPHTNWWDWLPEALMTLWLCTTRSRGMTPYVTFK